MMKFLLFLSPTLPCCISFVHCKLRTDTCGHFQSVWLKITVNSTVLGTLFKLNKFSVFYTDWDEVKFPEISNSELDKCSEKWSLNILVISSLQWVISTESHSRFHSRLNKFAIQYVKLNGATAKIMQYHTGNLALLQVLPKFSKSSFFYFYWRPILEVPKI